MWGRRRPRGTRLSRLLALGRLEEAMARAEQQQEEEEGEPEAMPYPQASNPAAAVPAARPGHFAQDVPVDNSAAPAGNPAADPAAEADAAPQHHQELPVQRTRGSTRHGSFG
jgi:hypothetical protein